MKVKRIIAATAAVVMLAFCGTVTSFAETPAQTETVCNVSFQSATGLARPAIKIYPVWDNDLCISWSKVKGAGGYKVYQKKSSGWKCIKVLKGAKQHECWIADLKPHTKYTFRVRAYKKKNGKTIYSKYSAAKSVTTKYGTGNGIYNGRFFKAKYDKELWAVGSEAYDFYTDDGIYGYFSFGYIPTAEETYEGDGFYETYYPTYGKVYAKKIDRYYPNRTLEELVEEQLERLDVEENNNTYDVTYEKRFGTRCAVLVDTEDKEQETGWMLAVKEGCLLQVYYCHRPKWQNGIKVIAKQLYFGINKSVMIFVNIGHNHFLLL